MTDLLTEIRQLQVKAARLEPLEAGLLVLMESVPADMRCTGHNQVDAAIKTVRAMVAWNADLQKRLEVAVKPPAERSVDECVQGEIEKMIREHTSSAHGRPVKAFDPSKIKKPETIEVRVAPTVAPHSARVELRTEIRGPADDAWRELSRETMRLKEEATRQALVALSWTPPATS